MITGRLSDVSTADLTHYSIDIAVLTQVENKISRPPDQRCVCSETLILRISATLCVVDLWGA